MDEDATTAAEVYERLFVPAEFQEWSARVAGAARVADGDRVLDVACGTGVLAREAARRSGGQGFVAGIDPDPGMIAVARREAKHVRWCRADAAGLPFASNAFDVVVSQFGLMYFGDRAGAIREMRRVLRSGGRLAVAVWGSLEDTPAYSTLHDLLARVAGPAATEALRVPFALGDARVLAQLFSEAGLPGATIQTHVGTGRFADARAMVEAEIRGWLPVVGVVVSEDRIARMIEEAVGALQPFTGADGRVTFDAPGHIVTAAIG
jgi:ubiquinone/menaquinone biosynthesis C-methylase UbiE